MNHIFTYPMRVRDYECDVQGHVNNAHYQHYFEVARHEFFLQYGSNFFDLAKSGLNLVVARVDIRYKMPMYGSESFVVTIDKIEKKGVLYIFHQRIIRVTDNMLCAKAKIDVATVVNGKLSRPDFLDKALKEVMNVDL
jgi:acyl-CoA thioester hydrolase